MKEFFRKHKRWLGFVGPLVVFMTFVVNEGIRENLKETLSSLSNERAKMDASDSVTDIRSDIAEVLETIVAHEEHLGPFDHDWEKYADAEFSHIDRQLNDVQELLSVIPNADDVAKLGALRALRNELDSEWAN